MEVCNRVIGFDIDKKSIDLLKRYNINNIYHCDITDSKFCKKIFNLIDDKNYDYIIFGDIIEHLSCPGKSLRNLRMLTLNTNSRIIITTPNVFNYSNLAVYIHGNEKVNPDHFFWPSRKTMDKLLNTFGFKIIEFKYIHHGDSRILKNNIKGILGELIFFRIFPHLRGTLFYIVEPKKLL